VLHRSPATSARRRAYPFSPNARAGEARLRGLSPQDESCSLQSLTRIPPMNRTYRHGLTDMSRFARRVLGAGALLSGAALVAAGCSSAAATDPASSSSSEALAGTGPLSSSEILGATACASTLTATYTGSTTYLAYSFPGIKGESVDIWVAPALRLHRGRVERQRVDGHSRLEHSLAPDEDRDVLRRLQGEAWQGGDVQRRAHVRRDQRRWNRSRDGRGRRDRCRTGQR